MANSAVRTANIGLMNSAARGDRIIVSRTSNGQTRNVTLQNLMANSDFDLKCANLVTTYTTTPANSTALTIRGGHIFYDANYIYIATANNTVKRVAIASF